MERSAVSQRQHELLLRLSHLPQKILFFHEADNLAELVLHELCLNRCFNLTRAAYFVDNPDFDCCKGVAGYSRSESYKGSSDVWCEHEKFSKHMQKSQFNGMVRSCSCSSVTKNLEEGTRKISNRLGMKNPINFILELRNGNKGVMVFEYDEDGYEEIKSYLECGFSLLGFCPIF